VVLEIPVMQERPEKLAPAVMVVTAVILETGMHVVALRQLNDLM
jgi:hypothetical protein